MTSRAKRWTMDSKGHQDRLSLIPMHATLLPLTEHCIAFNAPDGGNIMMQFGFVQWMKIIAHARSHELQMVTSCFDNHDKRMCLSKKLLGIHVY